MSIVNAIIEKKPNSSADWIARTVNGDQISETTIMVTNKFVPFTLYEYVNAPETSGSNTFKREKIVKIEGDMLYFESGKKALRGECKSKKTPLKNNTLYEGIIIEYFCISDRFSKYYNEDTEGKLKAYECVEKQGENILLKLSKDIIVTFKSADLKKSHEYFVPKV